MKPNKFFSTVCIVFSMCLCFSCGRNHTDAKAAPVDEENIYGDGAIKIILGKNFPIDSLDIRFGFEQKKGFNDCFVLSDEEFNIARQIVKDYFQTITVDENPDSSNPYPYHFYFKQFYGFHDPDTGKDMIKVNLSTAEETHHGWAGELKNNRLGITEDGGKTSGHIYIDMKQKKIVSFSLNGSV